MNTTQAEAIRHNNVPTLKSKGMKNLKAFNLFHRKGSHDRPSHANLPIASGMATMRKNNSTTVTTTTISTIQELVITLEYQTSLLKQQWIPSTRDNFLTQLLHFRDSLDQAMSPTNTLVKEMRQRWRDEHPHQSEHIKSAWCAYKSWFDRFRQEIMESSNKQVLSSATMELGRSYAENLETTCKDIFVNHKYDDLSRLSICDQSDCTSLNSDKHSWLRSSQTNSPYSLTDSGASSTHSVSRPSLPQSSLELLSQLKQLEDNTVHTPPPKPPVSNIGSKQEKDLLAHLNSYQKQLSSNSIRKNEDSNNLDNRDRAHSIPMEMHSSQHTKFVNNAINFLQRQQSVSSKSEVTSPTLSRPQPPSEFHENLLLRDDEMENDVAMITQMTGEMGDYSPGTRLMSTNQLANLLTDNLTKRLQEASANSNLAFFSEDNNKPQTATEVNSGTEECEEVIEINGKKYRRKYERRVRVTRHHVREYITAPVGTRLDLETDGDDVVVTAANNNNNNNNNDDTIDYTTSSTNDRIPTSSSLQLEFSPYVNSTQAISITTPTPTAPAKPFFPLDAMEANHIGLSQQMKSAMTLCTKGGSGGGCGTGGYRSGQSPTSDFPSPLSDCPEMNAVSQRLSTQLFDLFRTHWHKTENMVSPNEKSKTISYIQRYTQPGINGEMVQRTMCVQQTQTVSVRLRNPGSSLSPSPQPTDRVTSSLPQATVEEDDSEDVNNSQKWRLSTTSSSIPSIFQLDSSARYEEDSPQSSISSRDSILDCEPEIRSSETNAILLREFRYVQSRGLWSRVLEELDATPFMFFHPNNPIESNQSSSSSSSTTTTTTKNKALPGSALDNGKKALANSDPAQTLLIKAAPLDALLVYGTSTGTSPRDFFLFFETFMTTYKMFSKVEDVVDKLIGRYAFFRLGEWSLCSRTDTKDLQQLTDKNREKICRTIVSFLINVISHIRRDLTPAVENRILQFKQCLTDESQSKLCEMLQTTLKEQIDDRNRFEERSRELIGGKSSLSSYRINSVSPTNLLVDNSTGSNSPGKLTAGSSLTSLGTTVPLSRQAITTRRSSLLDFSARLLAEQLTLFGDKLFQWIDIEDVYHSSMGPMVRPLCDHHNTLVLWIRTLLYCADRDHTERIKYFQLLYDMAKELYTLHNYNAYIAVILGLDDAPDCIKPKKLRQKVKERVAELIPMGNRSPIYAEQMSVSPPAILYMGHLSNLLAYLETNSAWEQPHPKCPELGKTISLWRFWRHFVIINFFYRKRSEPLKSHYTFNENEDVRNYFNDFSDVLDEETLSGLKSQLINNHS